MALSRRCVDFLLAQYISAEVHDTCATCSAIETDMRSAEQGNVGGVLGGVVIPIYGGDLCGWCCIGTRRPFVGSTQDGLTLVKIAEHADAQCALVMPVDGRIGVSWSREFLPRYSHMTHFLEAAAAWGAVRGWRYADIVQSDVEPVLRRIPGCELIAEASGEYVRWWANGEHAVYAEPRLADPAVSPALNITVLTKTESQAEVLARRLRDEIPGNRPEFLLNLRHVVGEDHPELPRIWGNLTPASTIIDPAAISLL